MKKKWITNEAGERSKVGQCDRCEEWFPAEIFVKTARCLVCRDEVSRGVRRAKKDPKNAAAREWYSRNRDLWLDKYRIHRRAVIEKLGGKCSCCGEDNREFLSIDHVDGGGGQHQKAIGNLASHLYRHGWKEGEYRCLCHNCNFSFGKYGYCPHQAIASLIATREEEA